MTADIICSFHCLKYELKYKDVIFLNADNEELMYQRASFQNIVDIVICFSNICVCIWQTEVLVAQIALELQPVKAELT